MPKRMISIARYVSQVIAGALLMMWGVMNFSVQLAAWRNQPEAAVGEATRLASTGWTYAWVLAAIFSAVPFVIGALLCRSIFAQSTNVSQTIAEHEAK